MPTPHPSETGHATRQEVILTPDQLDSNSIASIARFSGGRVEGLGIAKWTILYPRKWTEIATFQVLPHKPTYTLRYRMRGAVESTMLSVEAVLVDVTGSTAVTYLGQKTIEGKTTMTKVKIGKTAEEVEVEESDITNPDKITLPDQKILDVIAASKPRPKTQNQG